MLVKYLKLHSTRVEYFGICVGRVSIEHQFCFALGLSHVSGGLDARIIIMQGNVCGVM